MKSWSGLFIILVSHIVALELLNSLGFITAFVGLYFCVKPMRSMKVSDIPNQDYDSLLWRWKALYLTSNAAFVAGGLLTDGILVS